MGRTLAQGQVFAGYTVERLLGVGGMGEVYLAKDKDLPRSVALKLLASGKADDPEVRARFLREADTAARLSHPNIVAVYARGNDDHRLWMAMQYVEGTDVSAIVREGPVRPDHTVRIIGETARALDHAHRAGVLHRDVKPANILLAWGPEQRVYLADFGIAKAVDQTGALTRTGEMYASFQYAAPEQFELRSDTDHRADVYALGCTLFHMLTGRLPYPGESTAQLVAAHLGAEIPRPSLVHSGVPAAFDAVIDRALAKNRDERFGSCGELAAAAEQALTASTGPWGPGFRQDGSAEQGGLSPNPAVAQSRMGFDPSKFTGATTKPSLPTQPAPASYGELPTQINAQRPQFAAPQTQINPQQVPLTAPPLQYGPAGSGPHPVDATPATPASPRRRVPKVLLGAFLAALLLAGGLGVGFGTGAIHFGNGGGRSISQPPAAGDASQAAATKAACEYAELMTTYDYSNGDDWQSKVIAGATGTWKSEAETLLPTIRVLLESDSEHTRAADAACTVTSGRNTHYDLAVDVTQINSTQGKADTTNHQKITLSMEYVDGKWLCSNLVSPLFPS